MQDIFSMQEEKVLRDLELALKNWRLHINNRLLNLEITKKELAELTELNLSQVYSVITGAVINTEITQKILAKIQELETQNLPLETEQAQVLEGAAV